MEAVRDIRRTWSRYKTKIIAVTADAVSPWLWCRTCLGPASWVCARGGRRPAGTFVLWLPPACAPGVWRRHDGVPSACRVHLPSMHARWPTTPLGPCPVARCSLRTLVTSA